MPKSRRRPKLAPVLAAALLLPLLAGPAGAQTIIDNWNSVTLPPAPKLEPATVDSAHTALLVPDMSAANCVEAKRPSCVRSLPHVASLLNQARAHHLLVVYSAGPPTSTAPVETAAGLAPKADEPTVRAAADKFYGTDLEKILRDHGIQTVIVTGTSAQAAVLYTATGASERGFKVYVPVDAISSETPFGEMYAVWHMKNGAGLLSSRITLTTTDMITFR